MGRTRAQGSFSGGKLAELDGSDTSMVLTLARGLAVLNCFNKNRVDLSNKEIANLTGLSRPTVSRLTYTLAKFGYLHYSERRQRYALGLAVLAAAHPMLAQLKIKQVARPMMQQMANEVGGAVSIGMQFGSQMIYVESCAPASAVNPVVAGVGSRIPLFRTAMGRAYLVGLETSARKRLLDSVAPGWDVRESAMAEDLAQALAQYRQWGFCLATQNLVKDTRSVGVPLHAPIDEHHYALNCGVPVFRLQANEMQERIGPRLLTLVRDIEVAMDVHELDITRSKAS